MHSNCRLLHEDIVYKITQRNNIRRAYICDPVLKLLNEEITSDIQKHKQNIWTIHGLSNRAPPTTHNNSIPFNNKIHTQTYCELFHQTIQKHRQTRNTQNKHICACIMIDIYLYQLLNTLLCLMCMHLACMYSYLEKIHCISF